MKENTRSIYEGFVNTPKGRRRFYRAIGNRGLIMTDSETYIAHDPPIRHQFFGMTFFEALFEIRDLDLAFYVDESDDNLELSESPEFYGYEIEPIGEFADDGSLIVGSGLEWPKMDGATPLEKRLNGYLAWMKNPVGPVRSTEFNEVVQELKAIPGPTQQTVKDVLARYLVADERFLQACTAGSLAMLMFLKDPPNRRERKQSEKT